MTEIFLTILLSIFAVGFICSVIAMVTISLTQKYLICAKIYTFIFEYDDWLLYKKAKKQGIQHYINWHHFSQFYDEWNMVREKYEVKYISSADYLKLDEETTNALHAKHDELSEKYYYKEFCDADESINDDDIVLSFRTDYGLYLKVGNDYKKQLIWKPMIKDILSSYEIWANGKTDNAKRLLTNPKEVVSF